MALRARPLTSLADPDESRGGRPRESRAPVNAFDGWLSSLPPPAPSAEDIALRIGQAMKPRRKVSPSSVYNLRNGYFLPGRQMAVAIEMITGGAVGVASWSESKTRKRRRVKSA